MTAQRALDALIRVWWRSRDAEASELAQTSAREIERLEIYCPSHNGNHVLTLREVENLLYAQAGQISDLETAPEDAQREGEAGWAVANEWCPVRALGWMLDPEAYSEHCESWREARIAGAVIDS